MNIAQWDYAGLTFEGLSLAGVRTSITLPQLSLAFDIAQGLPHSIKAHTFLISHLSFSLVAESKYFLLKSDKNSMKNLLLISMMFSLSAWAQFEDFDNILAPSTLTPKVGIICKAEVMFGETDLIIDVKNGEATHVVGDKKYVYKVSSFVFEKANKIDDLKLGLKGDLSKVLDSRTGAEIKTKSLSGSFSFNSALPSKDGKKFKAKSLSLASNASFESGSSFNIGSDTTNSTSCQLVKGGDYIKQLNSSTSVRIAGEYPRPQVDNSDRNLKKEVDGASRSAGKATGAKSTDQ